MPNITIAELPNVVVPIDAPATFLEVSVLEAGVEVSRRIAADDLSSAFGLDATFVTQSANAILPNERVLTAGTDISVVDSGPGLAITINALSQNPFDTPLVILADINTATPPTTEAVTDLLRFFDNQNVNELGYLGYTAAAHLQMFNLMQGGRIEIITADADGNAGDMDIETGRSLVDGSGGDLFIDVGNGLLTGAGGDFTVDAGNAGLTSNLQGGDVHLRGGSGGGTGAGGPIQLDAGPSGVGATGDGGLIRLLAGNALSTDGDGGDINITGGALAGTGRKGIVNIDALVQIAPAVPFEPTLVMVDANGAVNNTRFQTVVDSAGLTWRLQATLDDGTFPGDAIIVTRSFGAISSVTLPSVTIIPSTGEVQIADDRLMAWGTGLDLTMKWDNADNQLEFSSATGNVAFRDGMEVRIQGIGGEEFAALSHDETDFTFAYTLTTSAIQTGAASYDFITDQDVGWRLDDNGNEIMRILPRDGGAFITTRRIQYHNDDNQWTIVGDIQFDQATAADAVRMAPDTPLQLANANTSFTPLRFGTAGVKPTSGQDGLYMLQGAGEDGIWGIASGLRHNLSFIAPNTLVYEFDTDTNTATDPGLGEWKMNNATPASVTEIAIDDRTQSSGDFGSYWGANLTTGDKIFIKQQNDETKYLVLTVSGALIDGTGFWRIPVTVEDSGVIFDTTEPCSLQFNQAVATGAGSAATTFVIRADINTATPPTTETPVCEIEFRDLDGTDLLGTVGFGGNNDMVISNEMHGGELFLRTQDAGGVVRTGLELAASTILRSTGNLALLVTNTENALLAIANGATSLFHNNLVKLATTATGIQVTGTVVSDGMTFGDSEPLSFGASLDITMQWDGVDMEVAGLAASQIWNWRDGGRHRWYDPTDAQYVEIEPVSATVFNFNLSNSSAGMLFNGANFWRFLDGSVQCEAGLVVNGAIAASQTFEVAGIERAEFTVGDTSMLLVLIQSSGDIFTIRNGINDMWSIQETGGMTVFENGAADTDFVNILHTGTNGQINTNAGSLQLLTSSVIRLFVTDPTVTGVTSSASIFDNGSVSHDVGFNDLQIFNDNVSDTLEARHAGQIAFKDAAGALTLTLASNVDLDFPIETMTTVINGFTSGDYTITEGASTTLFYLDGTTRIDTAGGAIVGPGGVANIWRESATVYYIWGTGITP